MMPPFPQGTITQFAPRTPYFFLSNFYPYSISYEGITYPSNEHAYQAAKSLDDGVRKEIMRCGSAAAAKKMGQQVILRPDWNQIKLKVMEDLVRAKFLSPGVALKFSLWNTGDALLIEGNYWHDRYWGQCFCAKHNWEGENHLGEILMKVRGEIEGWEQWNRSK